MAVETIGADAGIGPILAFGLVGVLGVGSQWLAWRLRMPAIVLMLVAGLLAGPAFGLLDPARDFGSLLQPMIAIAVALILFEGGLTLNFHRLRDASSGVLRLVVVGAPLGWLTSTLALRFAAGLSWESAVVFGGIMIVTGPTVIAPLLRTARLSRRPAALLQWEAIVNDPIGALAAVLAFEVVVVLNAGVTLGAAITDMVIGIVAATLLGWLGGVGLARSFRRGLVPEYMKVPVLVVGVLIVFAASDSVLHESGLLAVTIMGIVLANADLPSYAELRRFKEHVTVLLVSGVFILLAAGLKVEALAQLGWRDAAFIGAVILLARPLTVLLSLVGSGLPRAERLLVAFTGPRGVVLVAVAGLFGERLVALGIEDATRIGPLAFALVAVTVVLHGFGLAPMGRALGLTGSQRPGVLIVGASSWSLGLAEAFRKAELPVLISDQNHFRLSPARAAGFPTFTGDILSESAEHRIELVNFGAVVAASDNDAYNTLVATDLAPEFGRDNIWQIKREKSDSARHMLPSSLGGQAFGADNTYAEWARREREGWSFRVTRLTDEFSYSAWQETFPEAIQLGWVDDKGTLRLRRTDGTSEPPGGVRLLHLLPPDAEQARPNGDGETR